MKNKTIFGIAFLLILLLSAAYASAAQSDQGHTQVKLIKEVNIASTENALAMFTDLSPKATQLGMDSAQIIGSVTARRIGADTYKVRISWHTIQGNVANNTGKAALSPPLESVLTIKGQTISGGQIITAQGDLQAMMRNFKESINPLNPNSNPSGSIVSPQSNTNSLASTTDPQQSTPFNSGLTNTSATPATTTNTNMEACPNVVDLNAMVVYEQKREVKKDTQGNVISQGTCQNDGNAYPIIKQYGGTCTPVPDTADGVVHEAYRMFSMIAGQEYQIKNCTIDTSKPIPLVVTTDGCSVRPDFEANKGFVQERSFYVYNGKSVDVQSCHDSGSSYPLYTTTDTCSPLANSTNATVIPQTRVAYKDKLGQVQFVSQCTPTSASVYEETCQGRLQNDMTTGQSVQLTKKYIIMNGQRDYLTDCTASNVTYKQQQDTTSCPEFLDDAGLYGQAQAKTYVDTSSNPNSTAGRVDVTTCQPVGPKISYVKTGAAWKVKSKMTEALGTVTLDDSNYTHFGSWSLAVARATSYTQWGDGTAFNPAWSVDIYDISDYQPGTSRTCAYKAPYACLVRICTAGSDRTTYVEEKTYLRPDGTNYVFDDPATLQKDVAGGTTRQPSLP